ncbi:hypothetical protein RFZ01_02195, partial [Acinetobacter pittii]|uniref:hypothetical protein n=1 Tax=Acinetobacter pittii TaxID=48296 RepID=UPI0028138964
MSGFVNESLFVIDMDDTSPSILPIGEVLLELKICVYDYPLSSFLTFKEPTPTAIDAIMDATPVVYLEGKFLERVY